MTSNPMKIAFLAIGLVFLLGTLAWGGGPVRARQQDHQRKIYNGVRSGKITPHEYQRLTREQYRIQNYKHRALSDGRLNRQEYRRLDRMQDRASRHIYRSKQNGRKYHRSYGHGYPYYNRHHRSAYRHSYGSRSYPDGYRFKAQVRQPGLSLGGSVWGGH